ncbi:hypothetical protein D3C87_1303570 [compost metagenome]
MICRTRPWILSTKRLNEPASSPSSSWLVMVRRRVRSPSPAAMSSRLAFIKCSGRRMVLASSIPAAAITNSTTTATPTMLSTMPCMRSWTLASTTATCASMPSRLTEVPTAMSHFGRYSV